MARYQLLRPSPVKVFPRRVRRDDPIASTMPVAEAEEEEGPESPDSPFSSPSTVGGDISESEDSDSDDDEEPPSPAKSGASATSTAAPVATLGDASTNAPSVPTSLVGSSSAATKMPSFTFGVPSAASNAPQPQITSTTLSTAVRPTITSTVIKEVKPTKAPELSSSIAPVSLTPPPPSTAEPELSGGTSVPQRLPQREQEPIMTKEAMTASIVLGVLGSSHRYRCHHILLLILEQVH
jgi:hypothetical protein